jgi:hypothetical protein
MPCGGSPRWADTLARLPAGGGQLRLGGPQRLLAVAAAGDARHRRAAARLDRAGAFAAGRRSVEADLQALLGEGVACSSRSARPCRTRRPSTTRGERPAGRGAGSTAGRAHPHPRHHRPRVPRSWRTMPTGLAELRLTLSRPGEPCACQALAEPAGGHGLRADSAGRERRAVRRARRHRRPVRVRCAGSGPPRTLGR